MAGLLHLFVVCALMLVGGLSGGLLPLLLKVDASTLKLLNIFGAGMLVGTALAVIFPEGFGALDSSGHRHHVGHTHAHVEEAQPLLTENGESHGHVHVGHVGSGRLQHKETPHWAPGLAILLGFLTMLVLGYLQHHYGEHAHGGPACGAGKKQRCSPTPSPTQLSPLSGSFRDNDNESMRTHARSPRDDGGLRRATLEDMAAARNALVGLVVHSMADGLAVGISSVSSSGTIALMVGLAMVLHKAPVAFGLGVFLRNAAWSVSDIVQGVSVFAATSPVVALAVYGLFSKVSFLTSPSNVALAVLFSGGTFLHASLVHILPEAVGNASDLQLHELLLLSVGIFTPLLASVAIPHGH